MKFKPGNIVHFHSLIGMGHEGKEYLVENVWYRDKGEYRWAYRLAGKAGYVVEPGLSLARKTPLDSMRLRVEMGDGSHWDIPVGVIAVSRAKHYVDEFAGSLLQSYTDDTMLLFATEKDEIIDYAANNMNWSDVARYAIKVKEDDPVDYQEGWVNGEKEVLNE